MHLSNFLYGKMNTTPETIIAIVFGTVPTGFGKSKKLFDWQKLPKEYIIGPK